MFYKIKDVLEIYNVKNYWLIQHSVKVFNQSYVNKMLEKSEHKISYNILFFIYDGKLGRIEFDNVSYDTLIYIIKSYIDNNELYCKIKRIPAVFNGYYKKDKYSNNYDIVTKLMSEELNTYLEIDKNVICENSYVQDEIKLYYKDKIYNLYRYENNMNICFGNHIANSKNKPCIGYIKDIINKKEKYIPQNNMPIHLKRGIIRISRSIFSFMLNLLMQLFDGEKIVHGDSIITPESFGNQLFKEEITIIDKKYKNHFDAEGIEIKDKILVKKGVICESLNNIKTANILNLEPGNTYFDFFNNTNISKASLVQFNYDCNKKDIIESDVYLYDITDVQVIIDNDTGIVCMNFIGINNVNQINKYYINENIFKLFNCIISIEGEYLECNNCFIPEIIVDMEEATKDSTKAHIVADNAC